MLSSKPHRFVRVVVAALLTSAALSGATQARDFFQPGFDEPNRDARDHDGYGYDNDPVVFSFATMGDSRTETASPDPTTLLEPGTLGTASNGATLGTASGAGQQSLTGTLLPQDSTFLTNTKALARILRGVQREKPSLLFFNGDMVYGYGRPTLPSAWANGQLNSATTPAASLAPDALFEYRQYAYWRGIVAPLFETGTYVVPVPGNHETQCNQTSLPYSSSNPNPNCATGKHSYADNENAFRDNMGDLIEDIYTNERFQAVSGVSAIVANGFPSLGAAPASSTNNGPISTDQTELSYSFDVVLKETHQLLHFVVIDTDPTGSDATAPSDWLAADLASAKTRASANKLTPKYFVFGHKPAFTYGYDIPAVAGTQGPAYAPNGLDAVTTSGAKQTYNYTKTASSLTTDGVTIQNTQQMLLDTKPQTKQTLTYYPLVNMFWAVIAHYNATYFSGHEHIVHVEQFADITGASKNTPYQVIVGAGGSPFDASLVGTCASSCAEPVPFTNWQDRYYGWATVQVHRSGNVTLEVRGFSDGAQYNASSGAISKVGVETPSRVLYSVSHLQ